MVFQPEYTVCCRRDGASWLVEISQLASSVAVGRLADARQAAARLISTAMDLPVSAVKVRLTFEVSEHTQALIQAADQVRRSDHRLSTDRMARRRTLARRLAADGFAVADIAFLLDVSLVRAHQFIGVRGRTTSPKRSHPSGSVRPAHESPRVRPHASYKHEAVFYRGHRQFLSMTVPFVREGLELDQPVMVAVIEPRLELLRRALGHDAESVRFVDMGQLGANPAQIIPCWRRFVDENAPFKHPMRGIGEPIWAGRTPEELRECQLHEALLNLAVDPDTPMWLSCPYDADALDEELVAEAQRSHPALVDDVGYRGSTTYGGLHHVNQIFSAPLIEPSGSTSRLVFEKGTVRRVSAFVIGQARGSGLESTRIESLATAVTAIAVSSVESGAGPGVVRAWRDDRAFVCEVTDSGHFDDPLIGRVEPSDDAAGRAVWLANELCDLTQLRSAPDGRVFRVLNWL
jgi:hypothetical protein